MDLKKSAIIFFLVSILAISFSNHNVLAASGKKCIAQCVPGVYEYFECIHDCITERYDDGRCYPGPNTGKCCCTSK
ncbi:hypothetical protein CARUB_v10024676mg [Capsella rubella]|uniref:Defensin-like domain-containing protein n=1 Tax=Capsella rubella TaxID=81985 RepID=R0HSY2_9BRAS|nr:hypothetical protein CARUB_v10024676mg [Capsella rubella]